VLIPAVARHPIGVFAVLLCAISAPAPSRAADEPTSGAGANETTESTASAAPTPEASGRQPSAVPARTFELSAYDVEGNTLLDQLTIEKAVYPHLGPGRTPEDVEKARAALEAAYQARGYNSVVVQVPQQNVAYGIVRLRVTEARVGRVRVVGAEYHRPSVLREQMPSLKEGQVPDFRRVQADLVDVNRTPDRRVTPSLKPGRAAGTVDVELRVKDNFPLHGAVEVNNDHGRNSPSLRALGRVTYANLWQRGHSLTATYLTAPENPSAVQVVSGSYYWPLWGTPWSLLATGYISNSETATLGGLNVLGDGHGANVRAYLTLPPDGNFAHSLSFGIDYKHSNETQVDSIIGPISVVPITYYPISFSYNADYTGETFRTTAAITATAGIRGLGSDRFDFNQNRAFADGNFVILNGEVTHTQKFGAVEAALRLTGQLADQPLITTEQLAAGGNTSVRGYLQAEALGDNGVAGALELRSQSYANVIGAPLDDWRFYLFADAAQLWVLRALPEQQSNYSLYSVGMGTRIAAFDYFAADLVVALPLRDGPATQGRHPTALFTVKAEF
jgi:hemolysin activation/secretion protein